MKDLSIPFILSLILIFTGCKKLEEDSASSLEATALEDSIEAAITAISGISDEQTDADLAGISKEKTLDLLHLLSPVNKAYANTECIGRAVGQPCSNGSRSIQYQSCQIPGSSQLLDGLVDLAYSDSSDCRIDDENDTVIRTYDYTRTTSWGATVHVSSEDNTDYKGDTYGGGARLTRLASGYQLDILGKHKTRTSLRGRARLNLSIKTTESLLMNSLSRADRIISDGVIEINHNLRDYTVSLSPQDLEYDASCCYPVAGTLAVEYSGSLNGSGEVQFTSCGNATVTKDADSYQIEFYSCE